MGCSLGTGLLAHGHICHESPWLLCGVGAISLGPPLRRSWCWAELPRRRKSLGRVNPKGSACRSAPFRSRQATLFGTAQWFGGVVVSIPNFFKWLGGFEFEFDRPVWPLKPKGVCWCFKWFGSVIWVGGLNSDLKPWLLQRVNWKLLRSKPPFQVLEGNVVVIWVGGDSELSPFILTACGYLTLWWFDLVGTGFGLLIRWIL